MKKQAEQPKIEIVFKNDIDAKNKLVYFIINKILEDYDKYGGLIYENRVTDWGWSSGKPNKESL